MVCSAISKKPKRIRPKPGDVLQVNLKNGVHSYAHITENKPLVIFYAYNGKESLSLDAIIRLPIAFRVWVFDDVIKNGRWPRIGNIGSKELSVNPYFYKQDPISGRLAIYHDDFVDTNFERPATFSEIEGLECAMVWDWGNIEERLEDHFDPKTGPWNRGENIDYSKIPE